MAFIKPQLSDRPDYRNGPFVDIPMPITMRNGHPASWFGELWWNQCGRKRAFFDMESAQIKAWIIGGARRRKSDGKKLLAYHCQWCEWWHIGHSHDRSWR